MATTTKEFKRLLHREEFLQNLIAIPWGSWDMTGRWHYNPLLSMTEDEQRQCNIANGYIKDRD